MKTPKRFWILPAAAALCTAAEALLICWSCSNAGSLLAGPVTPCKFNGRARYVLSRGCHCASGGPVVRAIRPGPLVGRGGRFDALWDDTDALAIRRD